MAVRLLFATPVFEASLTTDRDFENFNAELEASCRMLAEEDAAGRAWSKAHGYGGYTSYASLDDLPQRATIFGALKAKLDRHAKTFAKDLAFDLGGGRLRLDSLWVNILKPGAAHSGHILLGQHAARRFQFRVEIFEIPVCGKRRFEDRSRKEETHRH